VLFDSVSENSVHIGFDISGKYLLSAGDKHVHVFHNVTGKTWLMISYSCHGYVSLVQMLDQQ